MNGNDKLHVGSLLPSIYFMCNFAALYSHMDSWLVPLSWTMQDLGWGWVLGIPTDLLDSGFWSRLNKGFKVRMGFKKMV